MARINVLVFPCGSENASEIHQALTHSIHVNLHGASSVDDHGRFLFERYAGDLPRIGDPAFDAAFGERLKRWNIQLVFATHDTVQEYLAPKAAALGVVLVNGNEQAARIARRKSLTYALFADQEWSPRVYSCVDEVDTWPAVIKPDLGQGGNGVTRVKNVEEATAALLRVEEPLLVEYLPGEEVTVDCFTDRHRNLVLAAARTRERVRAGISMRCRNLDTAPDILEIAAQINARLILRGPWFFQLKKDRVGRWKLLEVSGRVAGAMVTQRARGINLPLMAVHDFMGRDVSPLPVNEVSLVERRILTLAQLDYEFDTVYVDFDETVIMDGKAIPSTLYFLYRMLARDKRLVLVTRHAGDVSLALDQARIAPALFSEIIHLKEGQKKSDFIRGKAIFVDNHFPERLDVAQVCGIPVFDVDALELIN
jgi:hypothetical protein